MPYKKKINLHGPLWDTSIKKISLQIFFLSCHSIKMDTKNMKVYVRNESYFFADQYQKDTCFYDEDAYYHYDVAVDRILLH